MSREMCFIASESSILSSIWYVFVIMRNWVIAREINKLNISKIKCNDLHMSSNLMFKCIYKCKKNIFWPPWSVRQVIILQFHFLCNNFEKRSLFDDSNHHYHRRIANTRQNRWFTRWWKAIWNYDKSFLNYFDSNKNSAFLINIHHFQYVFKLYIFNQQILENKKYIQCTHSIWIEIA